MFPAIKQNKNETIRLPEQIRFLRRNGAAEMPEQREIPGQSRVESGPSARGLLTRPIFAENYRRFSGAPRNRRLIRNIYSFRYPTIGRSIIAGSRSDRSIRSARSVRDRAQVFEYFRRADDPRISLHPRNALGGSGSGRSGSFSLFVCLSYDYYYYYYLFYIVLHGLVRIYVSLYVCVPTFMCVCVFFFV